MGDLTGNFRISGFSQDRAFEFLKSMRAAGKIPLLTYCYRIKHAGKTNVHCSFGGKRRNNVFDEGIHN